MEKLPKNDRFGSFSLHRSSGKIKYLIYKVYENKCLE